MSEEEKIIEDPEEETPEDFSLDENFEGELNEADEGLSQIDYTEDIEHIKTWLEINQNQNEEIKGLLEDINNNLITQPNSTEIIDNDYTEILSNIYNNSNELLNFLSSGLVVAAALLIIYFLYKIITPFLR